MIFLEIYGHMFQWTILNKKLTKATELLESLPNETLIYAIGNQVGAGQEILEKISKLKING